VGSAHPTPKTYPKDPHLPFLTDNIIDDGDIKETSGYSKGHMATRSHRNRTEQDYFSTFLSSDILPQPLNTPNGDRWSKLEEYLRSIADQGKEIYIVSGRDGKAPDTLNGGDLWLPSNTNQRLSVPNSVWKVVLILDRPGTGIAEVNQSTLAFGIHLPNTLVSDPITGKLVGQDPDFNWDQDFPSLIDGVQYGLFNIDEIESRTGYDFFSNIPEDIQNKIESKSVSYIRGKINSIKPAPLMASNSEDEDLSLSLFRDIIDSSIGHSSTPAKITSTNTTESRFANTGAFKISTNQNGIAEVVYSSINKASISSINQSQIGSIKISTSATSLNQTNGVEISSFQDSVLKSGKKQTSTKEIGFTQIGISEHNTSQISSTQADTSQVGTFKSVDLPRTIINVPLRIGNQLNPIEVTLPSSISLQQVYGSYLPNHDLTSNYLTQLQSTLATYWNLPTNLNLTFAITNLPTGQLAEGTITSYNINGTPKTATISIDNDANGVGWFLDTTPQDNSEFTGVDNYLQATPNSAASGKYDLLTAILHEMGHTLGIINGYSEFDQHIKNGIFTTDTFSTKLTPDGSHLDSTLYPYDLMNTSLKPGVRKLPSAMDWVIIDALNSGVGGRVSGVGTVNPAHLTAGALIGITNGDFTTSTTWNTAGATNIINGTATLTEQSQKLSELTQAFIIPTGAKTLQFIILNNNLITGDTTKTANDAFEVALLDTNTFNPLAGTSIGLNHTDSLLNIQANGTIHKSDKVTITALTNNSSIVTIDLTQVTPSTQATLYFNLLGFGARTSTITIDDVKLFTDTQPLPITKNDTLATTQNTPLTLTQTQLTTNDTNVTEIQIINQPTHGTLTQTPDGKLTYQPIPTYVGTDSFTYLGYGSDGQISNLATVNLTVNNLPPTIQNVTIPTTINEGQTIQLSALAKDGGSSENLTYTWNLGVTYNDPGIKDTHTITWNFNDGTTPITGVTNPNHTFLKAGTNNVTVTVTDNDGASTTKSLQIAVANLPPTINTLDIPSDINEGSTVQLTATATDPGNDSLIYNWYINGATTPIVGQTIDYQFTDNGIYPVRLNA
jgi:DNA/RNA endonuclease G (NUC1)